MPKLVFPQSVLMFPSLVQRHILLSLCLWSRPTTILLWLPGLWGPYMGRRSCICLPSILTPRSGATHLVSCQLYTPARGDAHSGETGTVSPLG